MRDEDTIHKDGEKTFYLDSKGKYHREDGPAVLRNGNYFWIIHGRLHREDGPAIEFSNG